MQRVPAHTHICVIQWHPTHEYIGIGNCGIDRKRLNYTQEALNMVSYKAQLAYIYRNILHKWHNGPGMHSVFFAAARRTFHGYSDGIFRWRIHRGSACFVAASLVQHNGCSGAGDSGLIFNEDINKWNEDWNVLGQRVGEHRLKKYPFKKIH